jgi:hypothetical protein
LIVFWCYIGGALWRDSLVIPNLSKKMMPFRGQASLAIMTSLGGKLAALVCQATKIVNKAEELTPTNIWWHCQLAYVFLPNIGASAPNFYSGQFWNKCQIIV